MAVTPEELLELQDCFHLRENRVQPELMHGYVLPWATRQPLSRAMFADVCGGQGVEAAYLEYFNLPCVVIDKSLGLLATSYHHRNKRGFVDVLPFEDGELSGILCKDAWMFLSPERRQAALKEFKRVLHPEASAFIISEVNEALRMNWTLDGHQELRSDTYGPEVCWREQMAKLNGQGDVHAIYFPTSSGDLVLDGLVAGFDPRLVREYSWDSSLARENPWSHRGGFIVELCPSDL